MKSNGLMTFFRRKSMKSKGQMKAKGQINGIERTNEIEMTSSFEKIYLTIIRKLYRL